MKTGFDKIVLLSSLMLWNCKGDEPIAIAISSGTNILLIVADDLGTEVGFLGDAIARTPNLDALAKKSYIFTNAYSTQPSCSPSRSSILTGVYPHVNGQVGLAPDFTLKAGVMVIPEYFKGEEYFTGLIGKLHVEPHESIKESFDWAKYLDFGNTRNYDITVNRIVEFLELKESSPFLLMVNLFDPHRDKGKFYSAFNGLPATPFESNEVSPLPFQQVNHPEQLNDIAGYYSSVARLDEGVGMILGLLEATGQSENTIIIFLSDHGSPFVRAKTSLYEAGVKVPFMVYIPGMEGEARKEEAFVSTVDLMPTILDIAGITTEQKIQGQSLLPLIRKEVSSIRTSVFTEFSYHEKFNYYPRRAIRRANFKMIHNLDTTLNFPFKKVDFDNAYEFGINNPETPENIRKMLNFYINPSQYELYDLDNDPYEFNNLSFDSNYSEILESLKSELQAWRRETNDE